MALVTIEQAKDYLALTWPAGSPADAQLAADIDIAEAVVLDYLKKPDPALWVGNAIVQGAILRYLVEYRRFRGDDETTYEQRPADGYLTPLITSMLHRLRDPACA
jgi:hypothetical protein